MTIHRDTKKRWNSSPSRDHMALSKRFRFLRPGGSKSHHDCFWILVHDHQDWMITGGTPNDFGHHTLKKGKLGASQHLLDLGRPALVFGSSTASSRWIFGVLCVRRCHGCYVVWKVQKPPQKKLRRFWDTYPSWSELPMINRKWLQPC